MTPVIMYVRPVPLPARTVGWASPASVLHTDENRYLPVGCVVGWATPTNYIHTDENSYILFAN
jgi:hypothetical protein